MRNALYMAATSALAGVTAMCLAGVFVLARFAADLDHNTIVLDAFLLTASRQASDANKTLANAEAHLDSHIGAVTNTLTDKRTGVLAQSLPKMLANVASASNTIAQDAALERAAFVPQSKAIQMMADNGNALFVNANGAVGDLRTTIQRVNSAIDVDSLERAQKSFASLSDEASSTMFHLDKFTVSMEGIGTDAQQYFHALTHPTKWQRIGADIEHVAFDGLYLYLRK